MIDLPKAVQRVEIVGMVLEEFGVKPFRLAEFAILVRAPGAADEPRRIWLEAWRRPVAHRSWKNGVPPRFRGGRSLTTRKESR
jgi:hypothetical protein